MAYYILLFLLYIIIIITYYMGVTNPMISFKNLALMIFDHLFVLVRPGAILMPTRVLALPQSIEID